MNSIITIVVVFYGSMMLTDRQVTINIRITLNACIPMWCTDMQQDSEVIQGLPPA